LSNTVPLYHTVETVLSYETYSGYSIEPKHIVLRIPTMLLDNEVSILFSKKNSLPATSTSSTPSVKSKHKLKRKHKRQLSFSKDHSSTTTTTATSIAATVDHHHHHEEAKKRKEKHDGTKASLVNLIQAFGEKTMMIFNAILYSKSIIFCANNRNAGYVIPYVFASLLLIPSLPNVLRDRLHPYVSFMNMDWLNDRDNGFIVGVTNPIFATRDEYFDFLCDIDTGKIIVSQHEKNRLQHKQMITQQMKKHSKIKNMKKHRHRRQTSISTISDTPAAAEDIIANEEVSIPALDNKKQRRHSSPQEEMFSGGDVESLGGIASMLSNTFNTAPADPTSTTNNSNGIVQSFTVKVAENDDVCYVTTKDTEFIRKMIELIAQNQKKNVPREETEELIRSHFFDYSNSVLELAFDMRQRILFQKKQYYKSVSSNYERKLTEENEPDENVLKTFTWRQTYSYRLYEEKRQERNRNRLINSQILDVPHEIHTLTNSIQLDEEAMISIFQKFLRTVKTRDELLEFLSYLPECKGGMNPIVYALFHSSPAVRIVVVAFLKRLENEGLLIHLNHFLYITYQRNVKDLPSTTQ
jgi:hypothetical protein